MYSDYSNGLKYYYQIEKPCFVTGIEVVCLTLEKLCVRLLASMDVGELRIPPYSVPIALFYRNGLAIC